jgi:prepilin-type N-terminal cleavage/methylation domain-containing protein
VVRTLNNHHRRNAIRQGFTLLELLVVVTIIGVLASLSVTVLYGITDQANEEATNATIQKIDSLLQKRIQAFERTWNRGGAFKDRYVAAANGLLQQDRIYGVRDEVVDILAKKVAMRHNFPQRHEDLLLLGFLRGGATGVTDFLPNGNLKTAPPADPDNIKLRTERYIDTTGNLIADAVDRTATDSSLLPTTQTMFIQDETVSSELLYYFLINSGSFGALAAGTDQFKASEIADTDDDGLLEFVDSWGNPLQFYRWPTRTVDFNPPNPFQPVLLDPSDPTDLDPTPDDNSANDSTNGREITTSERLVANLLAKGLPPGPANLPNGALPRDLLAIDPDDPVGRMYAELEHLDGTVDLNGDGDTNDPDESGLVPFRVEYNELNYHTPDTFHSPLIMSAGIDGILGLHHASDSSQVGHLGAVNPAEGVEALLDNLTNKNRRAGGR